MRARTIAVLLCAAGCAKPGAAPSPNESTIRSERSTPLVAPAVPADLAVPEGHQLTAIANAKGVQIYECAADAVGALSWKLHAPRAEESKAIDEALEKAMQVWPLISAHDMQGAMLKLHTVPKADRRPPSADAAQ